jgi:hypothetical protein
VRPLARLFGGALDRQLATGASPESSRLLAARAEYLVSSRVRRDMAQHWFRVLRQARMPSPARRQAAHLRRTQVLRAEREIGEMLDALVVALPVPARGVATASCLLTDGTGPLYNPNCPVELSATLREATAQLNPATPLAELPLRTS